MYAVENGVAPFTGAWIETRGKPGKTSTPPVAPFTGAWIETNSKRTNGPILMSRPSRARGLKRLAIFVGFAQHMSRPSRARGLKQNKEKEHEQRHTSRPSRARGLKRFLSVVFNSRPKVAPFTGAWIETHASMIV